MSPELALWLGDVIIDGKAILLQSEQGLVDAIQFCHYMPLIAARGARVILEVQASLRDLMTSLDGVVQVIARGEPLPDLDFHCPLFNLPLVCRTQLVTIRSASPCPACVGVLFAGLVSAARCQATYHHRSRLVGQCSAQERQQPFDRLARA